MDGMMKTAAAPTKENCTAGQTLAPPRQVKDGAPIMLMRIANPIYDSVFKHLMEEPEVARAFIERLVGQEILELTPQPHEITERQAAMLRDENSMLRVFRIDFSAIIRAADGGTQKVLIELQKSARSEVVSRFRSYLARHYAVPADVQPPLPIIAIYLLGFELSPDLPVVTKVQRRYLNGISGDPLGSNSRVPFIEQLTHDAVIVQIPSIPSSTGTPLERMLQVFNQHYLDQLNPHYLRVPEDIDDLPDPAVRKAIRALLRAASDDETYKQMTVEDEITRVVDDLEAAQQGMADARRETARIMQENEVIGRENEILGREKEILGRENEILGREKEEAERAKSEAERAKSEAERAKSEAERAKSEAERAAAEATREKEAMLARVMELEARLSGDRQKS